ncbi:HD domain-containing protein [Acidithiobacillus thiooxidans]|nr:HD domain-containing protein [Acidithiobacillus albertensis]MBU2835208.1 HD domain-containing protein [Acidithiobacillus thiooxidans]
MKNFAQHESTASLAEIVGAISFALDLTEGQPAGHSLRCTWIAMHIGRELRLDDTALTDLYYSVLLKDAGCSSNAARLWELYGTDERLVKKDYKLVDNQNFLQLAKFVFRHVGQHEDILGKMRRVVHLGSKGEELATELVQTRCERGSNIALKLGFNAKVAESIKSLDEHWNGKGRPEGLKGNQIPLFSQIALISQVIDIFYKTGSRHDVHKELRRRQGTWFNPEIVKAFQALYRTDGFWEGLKDEGIESRVSALEPVSCRTFIDEDRLDHIAEVFASIVDIKSPYTHDHSRRVSLYTDGIAEQMGFTPEHRRWLRRGALLHDVGKLGVSNHILDKPGKLDDQEWEAVRIHAGLTKDVLQRIFHFQDIAAIAGAHHERLDGMGYPLGLHAKDISLETKIITTADIFDAITAKRPYRDAVPVARTLEIMEQEVGKAIDPNCLMALRSCLPSWSFLQQ